MIDSKQNLVFSGKIINVTIDHVQLPNGKSYDMEIVHHPGGAAVVVLNNDNKVCLLKQYRYAVGTWIWEIPAGKLDNNENPLVSAKREVKEEAGVLANQWQSLGYMISSPGVFTEKVYLYLAEDISLGNTDAEEHEVYEIHWMDLHEALNLTQTGVISDAKSVIALYRAANLLNTKHG